MDDAASTSNNATISGNSSGTQTSATPRRNRYIRSSTSSVTQLLSDSCNSLLQRFRRNPSEKPDKRSNRADLSPSKSGPDINSKNDSMSDRNKRGYGSSGIVGNTWITPSTSKPSASALDRLRSNLSPVSSYYKPLMRTFGKRDDSPKRKDDDKDKTPTARDKPTASSTISRLESKYSDVLDRFARRRNRNEIDHDKTLEPDEDTRQINPLSKSATTSVLKKTTHNVNDSRKKERTPYRLTKNKAFKYFDSADSGYTSSSNSNKTRSELTLLNEDYNSPRSRNHRNNYDPILSASTSNVASGSNNSNRYKDSIYDALSGPSTSRYNANNNDYLYRPRNVLDYYSSAYDRSGKENTFKSRYDPDLLYTDLNNDALNANSSRRRQLKSYRRNGENNDNNRHQTNYRMLDYDLDEPSSYVPGGGAYSRPARRNAALQRSQTQNVDTNVHQFDDDDRSSADIAAIVLALKEDNESAAKAFADRHAKRKERKEIKNIILKYAEQEDPEETTTTTNTDNNNNNNKDTAAATATASTSNRNNASDSGNSTNRKLNNLSKLKSPPTTNSIHERVSGRSNHYPNYNPNLYDYYNNNHHSNMNNSYHNQYPMLSSSSNKNHHNLSSYLYNNNNQYLPLSKNTESNNYMLSKSSTSSALYNRSRIPKTLLTFVRLNDIL